MGMLHMAPSFAVRSFGSQGAQLDIRGDRRKPRLKGAMLSATMAPGPPLRMSYGQCFLVGRKDMDPRTIYIYIYIYVYILFKESRAHP